MRILRAADRSAVPWKNGGGVTREITASPEGASTAGFDWRISLADVGAHGPFSAFPDVDRTLTVVEGAGMDLTVGGRHLRVAERWAPHDFPGDLATDGRLIEGPVVNLNVMYRRGRITALTSVVRGRLLLAAPADAAVVVVALDGPAVLDADRPVTLGPYDAAVLDRSAAVLRTDAHAAVVTLRVPV